MFLIFNLGSWRLSSTEDLLCIIFCIIWVECPVGISCCFAVSYLLLPPFYIFTESVFSFTRQFLFLTWRILFYREIFSFAVTYFLFAARIFPLPRVFFFCPDLLLFCRELFPFAVTLVDHRKFNFFLREECIKAKETSDSVTKQMLNQFQKKRH